MANLVTVERVQAFRAVPEELSARLKEAIAAASGLFEAEVGRTLTEATYSWHLNGTGHPVLKTPAWPITAVTSLEVDGAPWAVLASGGTDTGQPVLLPHDGQWLLARPPRVWPRGVGNVKLSCAAGWSPAVVPDFVAEACAMLTHLYLNERNVLGHGARSLGDMNVQQIVRNPRDYEVIRKAISACRRGF